ncbi:MAG: polyprenyl synthetase family protein [Gammaproteobacteria bacterium]|nr:polyprenyl synthetase family protein [Gammaproteobacteria bacterium]MCP4088366.1 polyprenyl synthetase family protein [Gammaproteobacteria bacterium]MCP4275095.1 polyprenyl synthetase family protein [Gammaproteobacteria bacterium]MCP4830970.1 polyprenyl synthetase family protein [Gammaproteobacteria bacterium]MCP4927509.1 polyprenyl synthetase family protein [Gammaproteobacteria bacterium]
MIEKNANIQLLSQDLCHRVDERLGEIIAGEGSENNLTSAMRYALLAPGKRLRPLICLISAQCLGGEFEDAIDPACAIEMIHTASLIVDDLPCMDDAEIRRGKLSCHRRFGEATTILVALELMSLGYRVMSEAPGIDNARRARLVQILARAVGMQGLIGGQDRDLAADADITAIDSNKVTHIHELKTGALFIAAAESGGIVAGLEGEQLLPIRNFAAHLGLAYQTFDDLLDVNSTKAVTGKDVHQDVDKPTLVGVLGSDAATEYANNMIAGAMEALQPLGPDMQPLESLIQNLLGNPASKDYTLN